jgi:3-methyladenine DNA glycosylase/8-oxoguanine DNA glycosylase
MAPSVFELELRDPGGNRVDLWRALTSHGIASLPSMFLDEQSRILEVTVPVASAKPRTIRITQGSPGFASVAVAGRAPSVNAVSGIAATVRRMLRLEEDLSPFYARAIKDARLAWVTKGAGRMIQAPTVFEDVVKTVCTTNCSWALTKRMVSALVEHLGQPALGAPNEGHRGRAFPTPAAMAAVGEDFYRDVARSGYRGPYLRSLAESVAGGDVDLEEMALASVEEIPDAEIAARLQELPGVGPYAAAHIMMLIGRYSRPILDSWSRPTYARITRRKTADDGVIERRFRRYGPYAGLAFWLFITRDWVEESDDGAIAAPL